MITLTSAAANVTAISGGIIVFGDPMPNDPLGIVVQSFAFVLVIAAAAITPAPLRAGAKPSPLGRPLRSRSALGRDRPSCIRDARVEAVLGTARPAARRPRTVWRAPGRC